MPRTSVLLTVGACAVIVALGAAGCQRAASEEPASAGAQPPFLTDVPIQDLMLNVIDTNADIVWLSVTTVASAEGLVETRPKTDEEWARVKAGAITLAEAANLLMIPRRTAHPGVKSIVPGVELEPEDMDVLIANNRQSFNEHAAALYKASMIAADAADRKDADKIFEIGETIELACENCHRTFWYPNEQIPQVPALPDPPASK